MISLNIPHAAEFISLALNRMLSITPVNRPISLASSATPITAPREVGPTISPFLTIESVMIGAGSLVEKSSPFLIAVVSAMFCATLPGGTLCFAFSASLSKSALRSGSKLFLFRSNSNCSKLLSLLSIAASVSIDLYASSLRTASSTELI